jgi:hypothetical protein
MPTKKSATVDRMDTPGKTFKSRILPLLVGVTLLLVMAGSAAGQAKDATSPGIFRSGASAQAQVTAASASWPLRFEENVGQVHGADARQVRFVSRGNAYTLFLTSTEAVLVLRQGAGHGKDAGKAAPVVARMRLSGANPAPHLAGRDELLGKSNYFLGNDPAQWHTGIPNYGRVTAAGVYPGIDLVYHGNQGQLEYDFEVAPRADPHKIRFVLEGIQGLRTDSRGDLLVKVAGGELRFRQPVAYQKEGGVERPVPVRYVLKGKNQVAFRLARYDKRQPLLIDPVLAYSTYLGGSSIDGANAIAVAPDDSAFITGETFSTDFPTVNALFPESSGGEVAFVSKISPDGSTLLYSTYLGCAVTIGYGIAVDSLAEAYVAGTTDCPGFPVTPNAFDTLCGADKECGASWNPQGFTVYNGFVTKLNVEGSALVYSGFVGFYENVTCLAIAVDGAQNAYVTGDVGPNIAPTVPIIPPATPPPPFCTYNGFETTFGGSGTDAFVVKVDASGSELLYCSYLGGTDEDVGYGIAVDGSANAYVTGVTYSVDFPVTAGALKTTYAGAGDAFLTRVNTNATGSASLRYSTYLGGSGLDQGNGVAVDASGNAYVAGLTTSKASSLGFTPPSGAYQPNCALDSLGVCEGDAFVAKFALSGTPSLVYFTYLGGSLADSANGITLDSSEDAYVTGSTVSTDFPTSGAVFQTTYGGGNADAFVTELNSAGSALVYSTYLGGSETDTGNGIAVDSGNPASAYVAGQTCSFDFPLANPLQPAYGGNCDAFISKVSFLEGIALNPSGLLFPTQSLGTTSPPRTVTLTNGDSSQTISSISVTGTAAGDFAETNNCPASLALGAQCTITVTFTPTAVGIRRASVEVTDSAPGSPQYISLTGSTSTVGLSASNLAFGNQQVGVASSTQPLTVTNNGTTALTISAINASGAFSQTNDCTTAPLQPTTNCVVNATFTPTAPGSSVGALTIIDNAPGSPQVVLLTGTGTPGPSVSLSETNLTFGPQNVGTTSPAQPVTLTNTGGAPLEITGIAATGDFAQTNTCPSTLAAGASCTINVTFTPTAAGNRYGTVTIADNAANSPQTIILGGSGLGPLVSLSETNLTFGPQNVGTTSPAQPVTLTNTGSAPLEITGIAATGDFAQTNTCPSTLAAGASCTINVTFTPTAAGNRYGTVTIADNAANSPQTIILGGSGLGPLVSLSETNLTFGPQNVGTTSPAQPVTLTNTGSAPLEITGIAATGDFAQTNTCPSTLAAGASCTINVTFTPTAAGNRYGTVAIADNAANSPQTIILGGSGLGPLVSLSETNLTFAPQNVGTTSPAQAVTLANTGSAPLEITGIAATGDFAQTNTCPSTLAAGASCTINVTFTPTAVGNRYGNVTIADSAANSPQTIILAGTGLAAPAVSLSASSLTFGAQAAGTTSAAQTLTLTSSGTAALTINSIVITGDFSQTNTCPQSLAAGAACTISVFFAPTVAGTRTGTLTITDNGPTSPQVVSLGGSGSDFGLAVAPLTATVVAGNSTNLTVTVNPLFGYNAQVTLACSGLPTAAACTASPSTLTPNGVSPVTSTLTISTTRRTSVPPGGQPRPQGPGLPLRPEVWLMSALALFGLWSLVARKNRLRWATVALALTMLLLMGLAACGGGGTGYVDPTGTPVGTYKVTVNGSSGAVTHSATVTLTVQ